MYDGRFELFTGKDDIKKLGKVKSWNGKETIDGLGGECAKIKGTTGDLWPPVEKDQDATFFVSDVCRSLTFKRDGTLTKHDIKGHRWIGDDSLFDNGEKYPDAACWCPGTEQSCPSLKRGLYDASACNYDAPSFISYPHFYLADESYQTAVNGMSPSRERHESQVAVEPVMGVSLDAKIKLQLNMFVRNDPDLT